MKTTFWASVLLLSLTGAAQAGEHNEWFAELYGGTNGPTKIPTDDNGAPAMNRTLTSGLTYGGRIGKWHEYFGVELEYMHMNSGLKQESMNHWPEYWLTTIPGRKLTIDSLTVNGLVRYPAGRWEPFAGIGVGFAMAKMGGHMCMDIPGNCGITWMNTAGDKKTTAPIFTVKAGAKYYFTRHFYADLTLSLMKADFQFDGPAWGGYGNGSTFPVPDGQWGADFASGEKLHYLTPTITFGLGYRW